MIPMGREDIIPQFMLGTSAPLDKLETKTV